MPSAFLCLTKTLVKPQAGEAGAPAPYPGALRCSLLRWGRALHDRSRRPRLNRRGAGGGRFASRDRPKGCRGGSAAFRLCLNQVLTVAPARLSPARQRRVLQSRLRASSRDGKGVRPEPASRGRGLECEGSRRLWMPKEVAARPMTALGCDAFPAGRWW